MNVKNEGMKKNKEMITMVLLFREVLSLIDYILGFSK